MNDQILKRSVLTGLMDPLQFLNQSCSRHQADYTRSRAGPGAAWLPHWPSQLWWGLAVVVDWGGREITLLRVCYRRKRVTETCNKQEKPDKRRNWQVTDLPRPER